MKCLEQLLLDFVLVTGKCKVMERQQGSLLGSRGQAINKRKQTETISNHSPTLLETKQTSKRIQYIKHWVIPVENNGALTEGIKWPFLDIV